jgi:hypothetical protein
MSKKHSSILAFLILCWISAMYFPQPEATAQGPSFVSRGKGTVTHTAGALTAGFGLIGNGTGDIKSADGSGTTYTTQLKGGSAQAGNQFEVHRNSDNFTGFSISGDSLTTTVYQLSALTNLIAVGTVTGTTAVNGATFMTATNCSSSTSPAVCGSAAAGNFAIPVGLNQTLQVNTTALTANSQIFIQSDDTLGTKLGVTCNSTLATLVGGMAVTSRSAGASFTVTLSGTSATNPVCASFFLMN